jgi:phage terminase large subunit GpA-like protein
MSQPLIQRLLKSRQKTLKPKPRLNLVEFADQYRYLSGQSSALPGRWKTSRVEVAREPMLAATDENIKQITIMSCSQLLKSELINNIIAYHIVNDPCPTILMQPTVSMAESYSKDRIEPMIKESPALHDLVKDKKSRDSQNTILHKVFPGGQLTMIGANSPSELASRPIRLVLCDEVDRYPESSGEEGDPINLIWERSATFHNRKLICCSTPTIQGRSRIEKLYELSDQRVHCAVCVHCGAGEELSFSNVKWENEDPETARYVCPHCHVPWTETERQKSVQAGYYEARAPFKGHAGFKVTKLSSPWEPVSVLAKKFIEAKKNPQMLKVFVNTQLAESWVERGEVPDYKRLYERREDYAINRVQPGVVFLTAGADVQKDRIELEIVGWGRDKQSWSIDYRVIMGETHTDGPWKELDKLLNETWLTADGRELQIRMFNIDAGFNTQHVYDWVRKHPANRVRAIKGADSLQMMFGTPKDVELRRDGTRLTNASKSWPVGVSVIKTELYSWLKLNSAGDDGIYPMGFCHFPQYDEEYFKRLCSEQLMKKTINKKTVYRWEKLIERNESLDCRVYARAAAAMFGMDRLSNHEWDTLEGKFTLPQAQPQTQTMTKPLEAPSTSNYWKGTRKKLF